MSDSHDGQTYYELLEVSPQASPNEIYDAFQRARSTYSASSPALYSMFTPEEAQELMVMIEEAYQTLSHQARRREYDAKLGIVHGGKQPLQTMSMPSPLRSVSPSATPSSAPASPDRALSLRAEAARKKVEDPWIGPVRVFHKSKEALPQGFERTKFSVYEVKPELEEQMKNVSECDGPFLQKIRLYKGVTLDQLAEEIRVVKATLVALEANDVEALPVAVFVRGFVVQFARALGLDERRTADAYMKFFRSKRAQS